MNISDSGFLPVANLRPHRFAAMLPRLDAAAQARLTEDVRAHGVLQPVTIYAGEILDGRHRVDAARATNRLSVPAVTLTGTLADAMAYVTSQNIHRRQLNASQLALCAARVRGVDTGSGYPTQIEIANAFCVSIRYIRDAERLIAAAQGGTLGEQLSDLLSRVDDGSLSLSEALGIAFPRPTRERPTRIDPMPDNPALAPLPAIDPAAGNVITQAARAMAALQGDPTSWLATLTHAEARALVPIMETFARHAFSRADDEVGGIAA